MTAPEAFDAFPSLDATEWPDLGFWQNADDLPATIEGPCPCGSCFVACLYPCGFPKTLCSDGCIYAWVHWTHQEPPTVRAVPFGRLMEVP